MRGPVDFVWVYIKRFSTSQWANSSNALTPLLLFNTELVRLSGNASYLHSNCSF
jgi:hypothetical protein